MDFTLDSIEELTSEQEDRLYVLTSDEEISNGSYKAESNERTWLIFLKQANMFKALARDKFVDEESDANYEEQAINNYKAYLKYTS